MMTSPYALLVALSLVLTAPADAQEKAPEPIAEAAEEIQEGEAAPEPTPEPTPAVRSFPCVVDSEGERCTVPISDGESVVGVVAYQEAHTGKWIDFGWGPFNREDQPHGCDWVLSFRERLVEERGCFENGKRHGEWETCRLRLDQKEGAAPNLKCPKTEYDMGVIVVRKPEPTPAEDGDSDGEGADEGGEEGEDEDREEGEKPDTEKAKRG